MPHEVLFDALASALAVLDGPENDYVSLVRNAQMSYNNGDLRGAYWMIYGLGLGMRLWIHCSLEQLRDVLPTMKRVEDALYRGIHAENSE